MELLKLRRSVFTKLRFEELKRLLKNRIGINYKLGVMDNEEIRLYYIDSKHTRIGLDEIPICLITIKKLDQDTGIIRVTFQIATFALVGASLIPMFFMLVFFLGNAPDPYYYYYPIVLYPLLYLGLQVMLSTQSDRFQRDLRKMEDYKND